jgi:hypothetical protein
MAPRGMSTKEEAQAGLFRAMAWLSNAPLVLLGAGEEGKTSIALVRTHARAAMVMARLLDPDVEPEAAAAWEKIDRIATFLAGQPDDLTPHDMAKAASDAKVTFKDAQWIANVARVDQIRHLVTKARGPRLFDGSVRASSMRVFGGRLTPDGEALQGLVFPAVGPVHASILESQRAGVTERPALPITARDGKRVLPTARDVALWLGSTEARAALRETRDDAYEGFDQAAEKVLARRPGEDGAQRHASVYASMLDALATYLAPPVSPWPGATSSPYRRRQMEVALSGWTMLRHDMTAFARLPLATLASADPVKSTVSTPAFVEPHPEAIAALVALVRQTQRGLTAVGGLTKESPGGQVLQEVEQLLAACLAVAVRQAEGLPLTSAEGESLAQVPARMASLEGRLALTGASDVPLVADVHTDVGQSRVLEEGIGYLQDLWMLVREPRSQRLVLAVGAAIPHFELVQPGSLRMADLPWRARLQAGSAPPRAPMSRSYAVLAK